MNDNIFEEIRIPLFTYSLTNKELYITELQPAFDLRFFDLVDVNRGPQLNTQKKWDSLRAIINKAKENEFELIALLTGKNVSFDFMGGHYLLKNILEASAQNAEILLGHLNDFTYAVPISESRYWIDRFNGSDFFVIYRQLYDKILAVYDCDDESVFQKLSSLTVNKMVLFPFAVDEVNKDKAVTTASNGKRKLEIYSNIRDKYILGKT